MGRRTKALGASRSHGTCRICCKETVLIKSHAIPKAFFKRMTGRKDGYYRLTEFEDRIEWGDKQGQGYLLCQECDGRLGAEFDEPAIDFVDLIARFPAVRLHPPEARRARLARFAVSVMWRAHHLNTEMYRSFEITEDGASALRQLWETGVAPGWHFEVIMARIRLGKLTFERFMEPPIAFTHLPGLVAQMMIGGILFTVCGRQWRTGTSFRYSEEIEFKHLHYRFEQLVLATRKRTPPPRVGH